MNPLQGAGLLGAGAKLFNDVKGAGQFVSSLFAPTTGISNTTSVPNAGSGLFTQAGSGVRATDPYPNRGVTPVAPAAGAAYDPMVAAQQQQTAALREQNAIARQQLAAAPKLIKYDTAGAANASMSEATAAVTPIYVDKLNRYLQKSAIARASEQRHAQETIQDAQDTLKANTEQNALTRSRTGEDVAEKINQANIGEGNYLDESGTQYDAARRALGEDVANAGLAESGLGSQRLDAQQEAQGRASKMQTQQFENTRKVADLFKNRTFEDLTKSDEVNKLNTDKTTGRVKLNLEDFLASDVINEAETRSDIEVQRQGAVLQDSITRQQNKASAFIASLVNSGARAQDIELASRIYGGR